MLKTSQKTNSNSAIHSDPNRMQSSSPETNTQTHPTDQYTRGMIQFSQSNKPRHEAPSTGRQLPECSLEANIGGLSSSRPIVFQRLNLWRGRRPLRQQVLAAGTRGRTRHPGYIQSALTWGRLDMQYPPPAISHFQIKVLRHGSSWAKWFVEEDLDALPECRVCLTVHLRYKLQLTNIIEVSVRGLRDDDKEAYG